MYVTCQEDSQTLRYRERNQSQESFCTLRQISEELYCKSCQIDQIERGCIFNLMLSLQFPAQFACVQGFTSFTISLSLYSVQGLSWPSWFTQRNNISLPCTGSPWHWHMYIILYTILYAIYISSKPAVIGLVAKDWLSPKGAQLTSLSCSLAVLGCAWLCLAVLGCAACL